MNSKRIHISFESLQPLLFGVEIELFVKRIDLRCQSAVAPNLSEVEKEGTDEKLGTNIDDALDAMSVTRSIKRRIGIPGKLSKTASDGTVTDIKYFLGKPYIVDQGFLNTADGPTSYTFFQATNALMGNVVMQRKIQGLVGLRFTTVCTLHINAQKFVQGAYILAFMPTGGANTSATQFTPWYNAHRYTKTQITCLPHVVLDLACESEVQLRIPYASATNSWLPNDGSHASNGSPGVFFMYPYSPLIGTFPAYTLYMHYEDVEVFGNTVPQMAKGKVKIQDVEMFGDRPVSGGLKLAADISNQLSAIPLLSAVMAPASWLLDAASRAAWAWGWSKPAMIEPPHRIVREMIPYMSNADGNDASAILALSVQNSIDTLPVSATDLDEMSINFLKSVPSWFKTVNWTTANNYGTNLYTISLTPTFMTTLVSDTSNTLTNFTPVGALAQAFAYYTGSLTFNFRFVKTIFHTGRIAITFTPYENYYNGGAVTVNTTNLPYMHHTIIDLREKTHATITFPYVNNLPWRKCTNSDGDPYGRVDLIVLDNLAAPATVANNINILIEVCGAADMQFASPTSDLYNYAPTVPLTLQMNNPLELANTCSYTDSMVGGTSLQDEDLQLASTCIGESVQSIRSILKRGGFVYDAEVQAPFEVYPYIQTWARSTVTPSIANLGSGDPIRQFGSWYALSRGGIRIRLLTDCSVTAGSMWCSYGTSLPGQSPAVATTNNTVLGTTTTSARAIFDANATAIWWFPLNLGGTSLTLPFYHYMHSTMNALNWVHDTVSASLTGAYNYANYLRVMTQGIAVTQPSVLVMRAGADDFSLHGFVSIPPQVFASAPA